MASPRDVTEGDNLPDTPEGWFRLDGRARFVAVNPSLCRLLAGCNRDHLLGRTLASLHCDRAGFRAWWARLKNQGRAEVVQELQPLGDVAPVRVRIRARFHAGPPIRVEGTLEPLPREESRANREALFRCIMENNLVGIYVIQRRPDGEYGFTYVNSRLAEIFGYPNPEYIIQHCRVIDLVAPEDRARVIDHVTRRLSGAIPSAHYSFRGLRRDGSAFWVEIHGIRTEYAGRPAVIGALLDITERRRVEHALRDSEQRYRSLVEAAHDVIFTLSPDGRLLSLNPAFERFTGHPVDAWLGRSYIDLVPPEDLPEVQRLLDRLRQGQPISSARIRVRHRDGTTRYAEISANPVTRNGDIVAIVGVARDVTERVQAEQARDQIEVQQRLAAVGQLAAGIAHDFNNILNAMIGSAQVLQMRHDLTPEFRESLNLIIEQGFRAAHLIRQILDFSRQSISERRPLEMGAFLKEMVKLLRRTIPESIEIRLESQGGPFWIAGDPAQLQQIILNLALNARDAMTTGGTLTFRLDQWTPDQARPAPVPDLPPGEWVILDVEDTGTGIPSDILPRIFEPFFTTKTRTEGTGLGLAQVYGLVQQHDGRIHVESTVGVGTRFVLAFPQAVEATIAPPPSSTTPTPGRGETILLVEDDPEVLRVARAMLEQLHYRVLTAQNGLQALKVFTEARTRIDLVLTDMVMPEMDGVQLYHEIKRRQPDVKFVFITGYPLNASMDTLLQREDVLWTHKPLSLDQLGRLIRRALESRSRE